MKNNIRQLLLLPLFQQFILTCKNGRKVTASRKKFAKGTIEQYQCVYKLLQQYEMKYNLSLRLTVVKKQTLQLLKKENKYWQNFFQRFCRFLYQEKDCYDNYCASVAKVLRTFFNYLLHEKHLPIVTFHQQFKVARHTVTPLVLQPQQLQFLISNKDFEQSLSPRLQRTKDIFVFGCTVGLRYSDLMQVKKDHLFQQDYGTSLRLYTQKTGAEVIIPLPTYLLSIIEKYKRKTGRFVLPRLSDTNLNLQIKQLMELAGWTQLLPKIRFRQGRPVEIKMKGRSQRFCDQITAHTMRRTAITTLLMLGVPEYVVRKISGHAPHSQEFYRYVAIVQSYVNETMLQAYEKLVPSNQ